MKGKTSLITYNKEKDVFQVTLGGKHGEVKDITGVLDIFIANNSELKEKFNTYNTCFLKYRQTWTYKIYPYLC